MTYFDKQYEALLNSVYHLGRPRADRTGTGTVSVFAPAPLKYSLTNGLQLPVIPLITSKFVSFKNIAAELCWMLKGHTTLDYLHKHGVHIWDEWADPTTGELGPVYGSQWRKWRDYPHRDYAHSTQCAEEDAIYSNPPIDQIQNLINSLIESPHSRRHILVNWNVAELHEMALPPCHGLVTQFYVEDYMYLDGSVEKQLHCQMYQRSGDMFLGVPYNIASYALLTHIIARRVGMVAGTLTVVLGDAHIYKNHFDAVEEQLSVSRLMDPRPFPTLEFVTHTKHTKEPWDYEPEDFILDGYNPHPAIKAPVSV